MQSSFRCKLLCKISDLCSGFLELLLPAIVGVDPHRHVRRGVAGKVLDLLHRQAVFDPPGNAGVPELVRVDINKVCHLSVDKVQLMEVAVIAGGVPQFSGVLVAFEGASRVQ